MSSENSCVGLTPELLCQYYNKIPIHQQNKPLNHQNCWQIINSDSLSLSWTDWNSTNRLNPHRNLTTVKCLTTADTFHSSWYPQLLNFYHDSTSSEDRGDDLSGNQEVKQRLQRERESAVCGNDDGTLNFRIRLFSHYSIFGDTNLLLCSPTSPSGVLCTNGVKTQLQHVKNCLVQLFKNTGCSPPLTSSVAVCHVSASPRPISPPHHRLHGSAARLYPTDIRALQLFSGETTGILQTQAASWRWWNRKSLVERRS